MSETISNMPVGVTGFLTDIVPVTQGSVGAGSGTSRKISTGQLLSSGGLVYAGDPRYGVVANGVTDDTNSWALALAAGAASGAWVVAPVGVSIISSITIPPNTGIIGHNVESVSLSGAMGSQTLGSVLNCTSVSLPGIVMSNYSQLYSIQVDGNPAQPCIKPYISPTNNGAVQIFDVDTWGGSIGIEFNGGGAESVIQNCRIHECGIGINNPNGVQILGSTIASCSNHGIVLSASSNNNVIVGNRVKFSTNDNIHANGGAGLVSSTVITGNKIEAAGGNNISLTLVKHATIAGNDISRAARNVSGGAIGTSVDANILLGSCTGVTLTGNVTSIGQNDGATGYMGPYYAIWDAGSNTGCIFSGNILACHNNSATLPVPPIPINVTTTFNALTPYNVTYWE